MGPMTVGLRRSAHVADRTIRVRGLLNMIAMAVVEAQDLGGAESRRSLFSSTFARCVPETTLTRDSVAAVAGFKLTQHNTVLEDAVS